MGAVFRAERADGAFTQEVAAKMMRSAIVDADSKHRFKVERQILVSLRHPKYRHPAGRWHYANGPGLPGHGVRQWNGHHPPLPRPDLAAR